MNEPTDLQDARWRSLVEADATGEELSASDREFLRRYRSQSREVRAEQALLDALGHMGDEGDADDATDGDDAVVGDVVDRYLRQSSPREAEASQPDASRRVWWPWVAGAVAAAGLATVWLWPQETTPPTEMVTQTSVDPPSEAPTDPTPEKPQTPAPIVSTPNLLLASGRLEDESARPVELEPVTQTGVVRAAGSDTCVRFGSATTCFDEGTQLKLYQRGEEAWAELIEGTARVKVGSADAATSDGPPPIATTFEIRVAGTRYTSAEPAVWTVEVHESKATVDVTEGKIRIESEDGSPTTVAAGDAVDTTRVRPSIPDASSLLERARRHRAEGDRATAIRDYEALVRHHPDAPAARPSLVTLGELHLEAGHAKTALRWYDRYLDRGGSLEEEALYGRIRALRALGRDDAEAKAKQRFLERFPTSSYASKLRGSP